MTQPAYQPEHTAHREQEPVPDSEMLQFAAKVFNLARQGDTETLTAYVDAGVPANLCNDKGDTLVMLAAYHGHPQTVAALLKRGADPDRPNDRGQTPLAGAVFKRGTGGDPGAPCRRRRPHRGDPVGGRDRPDVRAGRSGRALRGPLTNAIDESPAAGFLAKSTMSARGISRILDHTP